LVSEPSLSKEIPIEIEIKKEKAIKPTKPANPIENICIPCLNCGELIPCLDTGSFYFIKNFIRLDVLK